MSDNFNEPSPFGPEPPQKRGMSTGAKVMITLGIVFGCLGVLCCGGVAIMIWWGSGMFSEDPNVVAQVADKIVQMDVPEELDPVASMDMKIPFTGQQTFKKVRYSDSEDDSVLVLVGAGKEMAGNEPEHALRSIDQSLEPQFGESQEDMLIEESYEKRLDIRGEPATFTISKGKGIKTKTARIQVSGVFRGKTGPVMILFDGDAEKFTEERVVEMLESIEGAKPPLDPEAKAPDAPEGPGAVAEKEPNEDAATDP